MASNENDGVNRHKARREFASAPLSETVVQWLTKHGTPSAESMAGVLRRMAKDDPELYQGIEPMLGNIAQALNRAINTRLNGDADDMGDYPSHREFSKRLRAVAEDLPDALRHEIPSISDSQIGLVVEFYRAWSWRIRTITGFDGHVR